MEPLRERLQRLRDAGLVVVEAEWSMTAPVSVRQAWMKISGGHVKPTSTVSRSTRDWWIQLGREWDITTTDCQLRGPLDRFLIATSGVGSSNLPWTLVSGGSGEGLVRSLSGDPNEPEFVCMALDGHVVCGVTSEEYDYWIVRELITQELP